MQCVSSPGLLETSTAVGLYTHWGLSYLKASTPQDKIDTSRKNMAGIRDPTSYLSLNVAQDYLGSLFVGGGLMHVLYMYLCVFDTNTYC